MRRHFVTFTIVAAFAGMGAALAQSTDGLNLAAIKARAAEHSEDAAQLAAEIGRRMEEHREEAQEVQTAALAQVQALEPQTLPKGTNGAVDFDALVAGAAANLADRRGDAPQFMVFVSLSMPPDALRQVIAQTSAAGGMVVFRGFPHNSAKLFVTALAKVVRSEDQFANIGVDPRLFRAFGIDAVPTYVAVSSDFDLCDGLTCVTNPPPYEAMSGNVSAAYALQTFAADNGPGARIARTALANLMEGS